MAASGEKPLTNIHLPQSSENYWERREELADGVVCYLGDCRLIFPILPRVDACITDPPYGIAHIKGAGGHGKHNRRNIAPIIGDATPFDPVNLLAFGNVIMWGADHYCARLPADSGRWLAWNKLDGMDSFDSFSDVEFAWHSRKGASRIFSYKWKGIASVKAGEDATRQHPTQKPIGLMMWCIAQCGVADEATILDPFMGSGTTGVAAVSLGRRFLGIEIEPRYFDIACRRISDELKRPRLPFDEPTKPVQEVMPL